VGSGSVGSGAGGGFGGDGSSVSDGFREGAGVGRGVDAGGRSGVGAQAPSSRDNISIASSNIQGLRFPISITFPYELPGGSTIAIWRSFVNYNSLFWDIDNPVSEY